MIVLADNDVIHKLACCDLLSELLCCLECPPNKIFVLPELRFKIGKLLKNDLIVLERFNIFLQTTEELPAADINTLDKFSMLDVGERQLVAVFFDNSNGMKIVTGDKRAIRQIAKLASVDEVLQVRLKDRVECLELIMLKLINVYGFEAINKKVTANLEVDKVFKYSFGRNESHALDALNSNLNSLRTEASFISI